MGARVLSKIAGHCHLESFHGDEPAGTYELFRPKAQGGRYGLISHRLLSHWKQVVAVDPTYDDLKAWLEA